ncbi:hypothetical protein [Nonomuraea sp. NPDC049784]|uniref:hypothetical protein n=1 Tax=Nonomuraea sp. NPDC049784 TaxID=3154361 RepID=UPI0033D6B74A
MLPRFPDAPQLPEEFRGRSFVQFRVVYTGDEEQGARLVEPLRALGPEKDTCGAMPYTQITEIFQDPKNPAMSRACGPSRVCPPTGVSRCGRSRAAG